MSCNSPLSFSLFYSCCPCDSAGPLCSCSNVLLQFPVFALLPLFLFLTVRADLLVAPM